MKDICGKSTWGLIHGFPYWGNGESQKYAHPPTWKTSLPRKPLHPSDHKRGLLLHVMSVKIYRPVSPYVSIYLHTDCAIPHW